MFIKCFWLLFVIGGLGFADAQYYSRVKNCPPLHDPNARMRVRQRSKLVKFICMSGYELMGNKYATCMNGQWDVPQPVCVRAGCHIPEVPNGVKMLSHGGACMVTFCLPGHTLVGSSLIYCNGSKWNDTIPSCIDKSSPPKLNCDFEDPGICGWTPDELHDFDWERHNSKTPSYYLNTGPTHDHTLGKGKNGYYMYTESTSRSENDTARLVSPIYNSSLATDGCFSFYYHMRGHTCGGLRVYQKPDNITMTAMLSSEAQQKYLLFEMWGNQGDFWYNSVSTLKDFSVDFQIVIEGLRGRSFTSDIAIDDVAILQGASCVEAKLREISPTTSTTTSTLPPLNHMIGSDGDRPCGCSFSDCVMTRDCCSDILDVCLFFGTDSTLSEYNDSATIINSSEEAPKTLRLVSTSEAPTTTPITTPTRATTTTTTAKTTTITTPKTTTTKPTTTSTKRTTRKLTTTTTKRPTTTKVTTRTTPRTTQKSTTEATKPSTTTQASTVIAKTTKRYSVSRPIDNDNFLESVEKAKKEQAVEKRKINQLHVKALPSSGTSTGAKISIGIIVIVLAVFLVAGYRSMRVRIALIRLRGRRTRDPEVQYFSTDIDDDN